MELKTLHFLLKGTFQAKQFQIPDFHLFELRETECQLQWSFEISC